MRCEYSDAGDLPECDECLDVGVLQHLDVAEDGAEEPHNHPGELLDLSEKEGAVGQTVTGMSSER